MSFLLKKSVSYLGHVISASGIKTDPKKTEAIRTFPIPTNLRQLRGALGLFSYYRKFVPNFSDIARPLTELTKKETLFEMNKERIDAFNKLKGSLSTQAELASFDPTFETSIHTNASYFAGGFMIAQRNPITGVERPEAFHSFKFNGPELNYPIHDKELMPTVVAVRKFRWMFSGLVKVYTDHRALTFSLSRRTCPAVDLQDVRRS